MTIKGKLTRHFKSFHKLSIPQNSENILSLLGKISYTFIIWTQIPHPLHVKQQYNVIVYHQLLTEMCEWDYIISAVDISPSLEETWVDSKHHVVSQTSMGHLQGQGCTSSRMICIASKVFYFLLSGNCRFPKWYFELRLHASTSMWTSLLSLFRVLFKVFIGRRNGLHCLKHVNTSIDTYPLCLKIEKLRLKKFSFSKAHLC